MSFFLSTSFSFQFLLFIPDSGLSQNRGQSSLFPFGTYSIALTVVVQARLGDFHATSLCILVIGTYGKRTVVPTFNWLISGIRVYLIVLAEVF